MDAVSSVLKGLLFKSARVEPVVNNKKKETDPLRTLWRRSEGPMVNGIDIDYSYYSPVENGADPAKTYPLVVIMAGALEGVVPGFELEANSLALWTAERFQKRFHNENAFLLIGRAPEEQKLYWDSSRVVLPFKAAIDAFVTEHSQVDTSRIYTVGWCLGGTGSLNLLSSFPGFFAAGFVISPSRAATKAEAELLNETPVWLMGCKSDNYISFHRIIQKSWTRIKTANQNPSALRFTQCSSAPDVYLAGVIPFIQNHDIWDDLAEDLHPETKKCEGMKTETGAGTAVINPFAIEWLSSFTRTGKAAQDCKKEWKKDVPVLFYEKTAVPRRALVVLIMLHLLDRLHYIQLYH